jgi:trypsin-like peptidase/HEAT repeat protein
MKALQKLLSGGITAIAICLPSVVAAQSNLEAQRAVVVRLHTTYATAAGVFVGKDKQYAYFITARHAVATEWGNQEMHTPSVDLWFYGSPQSLRAVVFDRTDAILDLGVVYVPVENLPPDLPQIVRRDAVVNGSVHIVGHPAAGDWSVWEGTVQNEIAPNSDVHHFVTTATPSLAKGYSGGPVFDRDGNFLGMHTETTAYYGTAARSIEIVDKLRAWQVPTTNLIDIPVADQTRAARTGKGMDPLRKEQLVKTLLESQDPLERARAVEALFPQPSNPGIPLPKLSGDPVMTVFRIGERALFEDVAGSRTFVPMLVDLLSDKDQPIRLREESAHSLAKIGGPEALEALLAALAGLNYPPELKATALHGPGRFWKYRDPPLLQQFNDSARLIIDAWAPEKCKEVSQQSSFDYVEESLKNAVILCAQKRSDKTGSVNR